MNIHGPRIKLRAIDAEDLPRLYEWANDPDIWDLVGGWRYPTNFDSLTRWHVGLKDRLQDHQLVIEVPAAGIIIGTANLMDLDLKNGHATHGLMIGNPDYHGKGYGQEVVIAIMRYAFEYLRLERLDSDIIEYNTASQKLFLERCHWRLEGCRKNWHFRRGRFWDMLIIGVNRSDYFNLVQPTINSNAPSS